jgi:meiotically up-regulated gene 157 (Mug157) protein
MLSKLPCSGHSPKVSPIIFSDNVQEKVQLVETLVKASAGTGWMHESFDVHNPKKFTRS